jgi:hypothetical protein
VDDLGDKNLTRIVTSAKSECPTVSGHSEPQCINLTLNPYIFLTSFEMLIENMPISDLKYKYSLSFYSNKQFFGQKQDIHMAWYLRKSVRIGPVRFNLSKSGIGTSVGINGFRVGVRPNGKSYLHAGRYGLYYRQELGEGVSKNKPPPNEIEHIYSTNLDTTEYISATSQDLTSQSRKELISTLNQSYKDWRLDYLSGAIFIILSLILLNQNSIICAVSIILGVIITAAVANWESKRRTVTINYEFEDEKASVFKQVISAFNNLASNNNVWAA